MLKTEFKNNILTAYLDGELDHDSACKIRRRIDCSVRSLRPRLLCLNLEKVSFMDSSGVGLVMGRYRQMKLLGGSLRVTDIPNNIYLMFVMSSLKSLGIIR